MAIQSGTHLGPYEIVAPLGAGGMGEVWRARDTRLEREVAIKILPAAFAANPQLRLRFDREAKTISSLNHPHICTLHDLGHHDGTDYLVLEMIEGESLADRLARGPLPLDQVLRFGAQIAAGLDAAHRRGIVHRDLKPGNVMLTRTGAKLLDFGLAKTAADSTLPLSGSTGLATAAKPLTQEGTLLGTFQYMAPEQLEGLEADARTDIFALGALLYEMVTGRRAFAGASKTSLIAAIVSAQPAPISTVVPASPPALDHVINRCLEKSPDDRWQSAHDVATELRWIAEAGSQPGFAAASKARGRKRERATWIAIGLLLAAVTVLGWTLWRLRGRTAPLVRFAVTLDPSIQFDFENHPPAVSPDGRHVAFVALDRHGRRLWLRSIGASEARLIEMKGEVARPFWSPDSKQIAFTTSGRLMKIGIESRTPETICENVSYGTGGDWSHNGWIVFGRLWGDGLYRVRASGGEAERLTRLLPGDSVHSFPKFFPDGKTFAFFADRRGADKKSGIRIASLDDATAPADLLRADALVGVLESGYVVFMRDGIVMAQQIDFNARQVEGEPFRVLERAAYSYDWALAPVGISDAGTLAYSEDLLAAAQLTIVDRSGRKLRDIGRPGLYRFPALSHDGRRVAVSKVDDRGSRDLWLLDIERDTEQRLTQDPAQDGAPVWSPDGTRLAFLSDRSGLYDLYEKNLLTGQERPLLRTGEDKEPWSWSPDGRTLLYTVTRAATGSDIASVDADGRARDIVATRYREDDGAFSPDGRFVAFTTDEGGTEQVHIVPFPSTGERWQVTKDGGFKPVWNPRRKEIFYLTVDGRVMSAGYEVEGGRLRLQEPVELFQLGPFIREIEDRLLQVSSDGEQFLVMAEPRSHKPMQLHIVLNWSIDAHRKAR